MQRRKFIATLSWVGCVGLSGCPRAEDRSSERATRLPNSPSSASQHTPTDTASPDVFTDLTVETERTWCPADAHWDPYYHRTPLPVPAQSQNPSRETVDELARAYETYVLTYVAVKNHGPQTPETVTPNEPAVPAFPDIALDDFFATVLASSEEEFLVRTTYTRVIQEETQGTYTVNYYFSREQTIRAEVSGHKFPGPNPTKTGTILDC